MNEAQSQEHFWGVELNKEKPSFTWTFEEEDEDNDYMIHTLFLKNAVLGASAVKGERNIIEIETRNFEKKALKQPLLSLTLGQSDMCPLDMSFGNEVTVTFRLAEGEGPVALCGQQLVEFPPEEICSQDESALEDAIEDEITEEEESSPKKSKKRKASVAGQKKSKKGKTESMSSADDSMDDDEEADEEDEEDDDEEDMDEDDTAESSPEKGKKKPAAKDAKKRKTTKTSPKKAMKKTTKKGKK